MHCENWGNLDFQTTFLQGTENRRRKPKKKSNVNLKYNLKASLMDVQHCKDLALNFTKWRHFM